MKLAAIKKGGGKGVCIQSLLLTMDVIPALASTQSCTVTCN